MAQWLVTHQVTTVMLSSNGIYTVADVNRALVVLHPVARIYHITLDAAHTVLVERVRQRGDLHIHPPEWLAAWQMHIRQHYRPWTKVIDTSQLTPEAVLDAISTHCDQADTSLGSQVV
jgi:hypothetical protein